MVGSIILNRKKKSPELNLFSQKYNWVQYKYVVQNKMVTRKTHRLNDITVNNCLKVLLTSGLALCISACQNLPDKPHTQDSIRVNTLLAQRYAIDTDTTSNDTIPIDATATASTDMDTMTQPSVEEGLLDSTDDHDVQTTVTNDSLNLSANAVLVKNKGDRVQTLDEAITVQTADHPNQSGYHTIYTGANAFAARSLLTDMTTKSIDVQYYIWHNDQAGQLLLQDLWQAAERGVLIRFLLDDFNTNSGLDAHLLELAEHPNIAVRLVNPLPYRNFQMLNYLTEMPRINRRMHNKSITFDRQLSILGGRNIGDEYLSNSKGNNFADLDVMLIGEVVSEVTSSFEAFWESPLSYDIQTLVKAKNKPSTSNEHVKTTDNGSSGFVANLDKISPDANSDLSQSLKEYESAVRESLVGSDLLNQRVPFRWAEMTFLVDDVGKLTKTENPKNKLVYQLRRLLGTPTQDLSIVSSYFVPTPDGVAALVALANQGVNIQILTNSFKATDVTAVHSGYAPWRKTLLEAGIMLYELKATATEEKRENKLWRARSQSSTSLHAKTFAVDDKQVFIGSYNIDPRSANINTELGVVINDASLARDLKTNISDTLLTQAYKLELADDGSLEWHTLENNELIIYNQEPDVDFTDKIWLEVMAWLPIDWLL